MLANLLDFLLGGGGVGFGGGRISPEKNDTKYFIFHIDVTKLQTTTKI